MFPNEKSAHAVAANDDLLTEILLRLPVRSLIRFKSVSKRWFFLITDPKFCCRRSCEVVTASGMFLPSGRSLEFLRFKEDEQKISPLESLSFDNKYTGIQLLNSCNGLMACSSFPNYDNQDEFETCFVCNPTTGQFTSIPNPIHWSTDGGEAMFSALIAFDPSKSHYYSVVFVFFSALSPDLYEIEIYSSMSRLWKKFGEPIRANVNFVNGVFWNGSLHWVSEWSDSLYLNLNDELLRTMPMPPFPDAWQKRRIRYFGESRNHLHLIEVYDQWTSQFNVYEMERDYSRWIPMYCVNIEAVATAFPECIDEEHDPTSLYYYYFSIECLIREENEEESFLILRTTNSRIRYNLCNGSVIN